MSAAVARQEVVDAWLLELTDLETDLRERADVDVERDSRETRLLVHGAVVWFVPTTADALADLRRAAREWATECLYREAERIALEQPDEVCP